MIIQVFHQFHLLLYIHHSAYLYITVAHIVDVKPQSIKKKKNEKLSVKTQNNRPHTFFWSTSIIRWIISIISCSSEPIFSSNNPEVITWNKHKYCLLLFSVYVSTFAIGTTVVIDGNREDGDVIEDSNVAGEYVRNRLQLGSNSAVIVNLASNRKKKGDTMVRGKNTMLLENWKKSIIDSITIDDNQ